MTYKIKTEQFEGPLDLLLKLIEDQEMDITKVSLAKVTDQYIQYLENVTDLDAQEMADFLVVAAKLLLIKSKALLPYLELEGEEEALDLEVQLKIYKEYLDASKALHKLIRKKSFSFSRDKILASQKEMFSPPPRLKKDKLAVIFAKLIKEVETWAALPTEVIKKTVNIQEKINNIHQTIIDKASMGFDELVQGAKDKTEVIVSFLALLELVKQRSVTVTQEGKFDNILIKKVD